MRMKNVTSLVAKLASGGSVRDSLAVLVIKAGSGVFGFLMFAVISRVSGFEAFGKFSVIFSAAMLVGSIGSLGQQVFLVKEVARAKHAGDERLEMTTYSFSFVAALAGSLVSSALFAVVAQYFAPQYAGAAALGGAALCFVYALSQGTLGALRVQDSVILALGSRDLAWRMVATGIIAAIPLLFHDAAPGAGTVLLVMAAVLGVVVLWHAFEIKRRLRGRSFGLKGSLSHGWVKLSAGLALIAAISGANLYAFSIVLSAVVPVGMVGPFFASLRTVDVITLFHMSTIWVMGPRIARAVASGDSKQIQSECNTGLVIQCTPTILACLAVILFSRPLLVFFNPAYAPYAPVLSILAVGALINALTGATGLILQLINLHWRQVAIQGGSLALALALLPLLVDALGLTGAALAYLVSIFLWNVLAIASIRRKTGVDPSIFGLFGTGALNFRESRARLRSSIAGH